MNFHMFFQAIATLSFTVWFNISEKQYQDIFLFQGNESQAHFFRQNYSLQLYLIHKDVSIIYQIENITSSFSFSWPELTVNSRKMESNQLDVNMFLTQFNWQKACNIH